jgi:hypothetical protein
MSSLEASEDLAMLVNPATPGTLCIWETFTSDRDFIHSSRRKEHERSKYTK